MNNDVPTRKWPLLVKLIVGITLLGLSATSTFANTEVPIAQSVPIVGAIPVVGSVVSYLEEADTFQVSAGEGDRAVYGVVGERPAIVFVSATNTVPVITSGVSVVRVSAAGGPITRGDLLTTSVEPGVAMRATLQESAVFAIALVDESFLEDSETVLLAEVGVERAQAYQAARLQAEATATEPEQSRGWVRSLLAIVLVFSGLGFLLYSFRSILAVGIQSVGRNPRARRTVVLLAGGSLVMVVVVTVLLLLAAIGVLVLPV